MIQLVSDGPAHFLDPDCSQEFANEIKHEKAFFARVVYISEPIAAVSFF